MYQTDQFGFETPTNLDTKKHGVLWFLITLCDPKSLFFELMDI